MLNMFIPSVAKHFAETKAGRFVPPSLTSNCSLSALQPIGPR